MGLSQHTKGIVSLCVLASILTLGLSMKGDSAPTLSASSIGVHITPYTLEKLAQELEGLEFNIPFEIQDKQIPNCGEGFTVSAKGSASVRMQDFDFQAPSIDRLQTQGIAHAKIVAEASFQRPTKKPAKPKSKKGLWSFFDGVKEKIDDLKEKINEKGVLAGITDEGRNFLCNRLVEHFAGENNIQVDNLRVVAESQVKNLRFHKPLEPFRLEGGVASNQKEDGVSRSNFNSFFNTARGPLQDFLRTEIEKNLPEINEYLVRLLPEKIPLGIQNLSLKIHRSDNQESHITSNLISAFGDVEIQMEKAPESGSLLQCPPVKLDELDEEEWENEPVELPSDFFEEDYVVFSFSRNAIQKVLRKIYENGHLCFASTWPMEKVLGKLASASLSGMKTTAIFYPSKLPEIEFHPETDNMVSLGLTDLSLDFGILFPEKERYVLGSPLQLSGMIYAGLRINRDLGKLQMVIDKDRAPMQVTLNTKGPIGPDASLKFNDTHISALINTLALPFMRKKLEEASIIDNHFLYEPLHVALEKVAVRNNNLLIGIKLRGLRELFLKNGYAREGF
jgi:hypothetical protein